MVEVGIPWPAFGKGNRWNVETNFGCKSEDRAECKIVWKVGGDAIGAEKVLRSMWTVRERFLNGFTERVGYACSSVS